MSDSKKYIDDVIEYIEDDISKIQLKPGMYISYLGSKGALHLVKELINNAIDECINTNSPGDTVDVYLDESENTISVSDNGRGIPPESMELVCTTLQSGSKFERTGSGGTSAGENGVGLTACNALSSKFEIIVYRNGNKSSIEFKEGKKVSGVTTVSSKKKDKHGTMFVLQPSKFYMGEECSIVDEDLIAWLDKIVYLIPHTIKLNLTIKKKGKESIINKKYVNKYGLYDYVKKLCKRQILDPIHFIDTMKYTEVSRGKEYDRFIGLEVAFTYNSSSVEFVADSFCNFVNTVDNGVHVDAVKQAIMQFFSKQTKEALSERESKNIDIIFQDVLQGLVLSVYLRTDLQPQFTGQTKEKLGNSELFKPIRDITYRAISNYFRKEPKELKKITDRIKTNAKARIESTKVRNSVIRGETSNFDEHLMANFTPANNTGKHQYRELFIIEGKSAKGCCVKGRFDNNTQALFSLRGAPMNSYDRKIDSVLLNAEFNSLTKILRCNIGERFDLDKLFYDKIIILSDSDSDGFNISSLVCAFFLCHLRPIVEAGKLYKVIAPLYRIKSKHKEFILDKKEYTKIFERHIRDNMILTDLRGKSISDNDLETLLYNNRDYLDELERVANSLALDVKLLEFIVIHKDSKDFYKMFKKKYPELDIDESKVLSGVLDNKYQILNMDKLFNKRIERLNEYIHDVNNDNMYYHVYEKNGKEKNDKGIMSLGEFLLLCKKFKPQIITRFKGLGELDPKDLCETTMNPNNRTLVRLTVNDIQKDLDTFNILHGEKTSSSSIRKMMMNHYRINREDLDN